MRYILRLFGIVLLSAFPAHVALGDSLYTFTSVDNSVTDSPLTLGFLFTPTQNFTVTSLGWFDGTGNGFQTSHTVGIYDVEGNLIGSTTLAGGTSDPLNGSFRYQVITPITLQAGVTYTLAGTSGGDLDAWTVNDDVSGFSVNPAFTIPSNAARFAYGSDFVDPSLLSFSVSHYSDYIVYAGPNLQGYAACGDAPEPASVLLMTSGAAMLLLIRIRALIVRGIRLHS